MNPTDFKERYLPFYPKLYRAAYRIVGDEMEAEDIVQDTYTQLWDMRLDLADILNPEAYSLTVMKNIALNHIKLRNRDDKIFVEADTLMQSVESDTAPPAERYDFKEQLNSITEIMELLPQQQRDVLKLRAFCDLSYDEIQQSTGLSEINIRAIISRARKRLKEIYNNTKNKRK